MEIAVDSVNPQKIWNVDFNQESPFIVTSSHTKPEQYKKIHTLLE